MQPSQTPLRDRIRRAQGLPVAPKPETPKPVTPPWLARLTARDETARVRLP